MDARMAAVSMAVLTGLVVCTPAHGEPAPEEGIEVGGAVRLQYVLRQWDSIERDRGGEFDLELLALDFDGRVSDVLLSAQYRFYRSQNFETVHHAWIGYDFPRWCTKLGIAKVPFGLRPSPRTARPAASARPVAAGT